MLTFFKEIFTWWNGQTLGTRLQTIFFGKLVGEDELGNKYYQNKKGKRWVIYNGEVEASKIPNDWYSWMHHTNNKIENSHNLKKYKWQKNHLPNQTGTINAYNPKNNKNATEKKYKSTKLKLTIGEELFFQNLNINILKCQNSKFDDDPEVTAFMQVIDLKNKDKDKVFVFNDWTFASSPSIRPFDHPVYDIWLKKCYS